MTVKQLIEKLSKLPENAEVFIPNDADYIDGYYAATEIDNCTFAEGGNLVFIDTDYEKRID